VGSGAGPRPRHPASPREDRAPRRATRPFFRRRSSRGARPRRVPLCTPASTSHGTNTHRRSPPTTPSPASHHQREQKKKNIYITIIYAHWEEMKLLSSGDKFMRQPGLMNGSKERSSVAGRGLGAGRGLIDTAEVTPGLGSWPIAPCSGSQRRPPRERARTRIHVCLPHIYISISICTRGECSVSLAT